MDLLQSALMGLIQGLGEFFPVSSSGHLMLGRFILGIQENDPTFKVLDILLHVGTLIPLLIVFWKEWIDMLRHPFRNRTLLYLVIASLPTLFIYLGAKVLFKDVDGFHFFDSGWFMGASFLITALFLLICDFVSSRRPETGKKAGPVQAVIMGIFQGAGLLPGVSRSGSTILGGVLTGLDKKKAASFSFMMSVPAVLGSLIMEAKDLTGNDLARISLLPVIAAILIAAVTGYFALRFMLRIISKVPLSGFAIYVAVIGIIYLALQLSGSSLLPAFVPPVPAG